MRSERRLDEGDVPDFTLQYQSRQRRLDLALDRALQRTSAIDRVVARQSQMSFGFLGQFERDPPLGQPRPQPLQLNINNHLEIFFAQRMEDDDLIHPVEKLGPEV